MTRRRKGPRRDLTDGERRELTALSRSRAAPAAEVARAIALLAVAAGSDYQIIARAVVRLRHCGRQRLYGERARSRILREARRVPTPEAYGTAAWSLSTLRKALRRAPDGLPGVSTYTIRVRAQRHRQGADAVPPRLGPGARRGRQELPERGAA